MKITTNHHFRPLVSWYDLPADERPKFEYIDDRHSPRLVKAYGVWMDTHDFVPIVPSGRVGGAFAHYVADDSPLLKWSSIATDSFYTAALIRYDFDQYPNGDYAVVGYLIATD